ncbi:MAG: hypothetical protein J6C10_02950, partial [Prevotella sp.]|nr:hypothetical protein [Prevotella sp.]
MNYHKTFLAAAILAAIAAPAFAGVTVKTAKNAQTPQTAYAAEQLQRQLAGIDGKYTITLGIAGGNGTAEGYTISRKGKKITIAANDGNGAIYAANRLTEHYRTNGNIDIAATITD